MSFVLNVQGENVVCVECSGENVVCVECSG